MNQLRLYLCVKDTACCDYQSAANGCYIITILEFAGKLIIIALVCIAPSAALAAQNQLNWSVRAEFEHDNNVSLRSENPQSTAASQLKPDLGYQYDNGVHVLSANTALTFTNFNDSVYNSDDQLFSTSYQHRGETASQSLKLTSTRDSSRSSEIDDTGFVGDAATRRVKNLGELGWNQALSETDSLSLSGFYQKTNYQSLQLADNSIEGLNSGWQHIYSARFNTVVQLMYQDFNSELFSSVFGIPTRILTNSRSSGAQLTLGYQMSELWKLSLELGSSKVDTEQQFDSRYFNFLNEVETDTDTYALKFDRKGETSAWKLSISQNNDASGNGTLRVDQRAEATYTQSFSKRSKLTTALRYIKRKALNSELVSFSNEEREYYSARLAFSYRVTEFFWASIETTYKEQQYLDSDNRADALIGTLALTYRPSAKLW